MSAFAALDKWQRQRVRGAVMYRPLSSGSLPVHHPINAQHQCVPVLPISRPQDASDSDDADVAPTTVKVSGGYFTAEEEENLSVKGNAKSSKTAPPQLKKPKVAPNLY